MLIFGRELDLRTMMLVVGGWGGLTFFALLVGLETIGGLMALLHLGGLIGAPLAMVLNRQLRSLPVVFVVSVGLSLALTALAVQALVWFEAASGPLLVLMGTAYGCVLAYLLGETTADEFEGR